MTRSASLLLLLGLVLCSVSICLGQVSLGAGSIVGTVLDTSGAAVPQAQISVKNINTGELRSAVTDSGGRYSVLSLLTGRYEVQATATGFKSIVRTGINIEIGTNALVDFALPVGSVSTEVTVTTAPPLIESSNATIGQVIENKDVVTLPLNGRSYTQLAVLAPGVAFGGTTVGATLQSPSLGASGSFSISGARAEGSEFTMNGITVTNEFTGGTYAYPPIDSVQEFKLLQSNYGAELGFRVGQVVVTTVAGTNAFHGSLYEFIRNDVLDAANFFNNLAGIGKAPLKRNQFGASIGGPVYLPRYSGKEKTFFFVNYEGATIREGTTETASVPTALMREGNFSQLSTPIVNPSTGQPFAGNQIPAALISPIALNAISLTEYPLPNTPGLNNNYTISPSISTTMNEVMGRIDHNISARDRVWGSVFWETEPESTPRFTEITGSAGNIPVQAYSADETHIFSSQLVNDFKFGWNYVNQTADNLSPVNITDADLGFPDNGNQPVVGGVEAGVPDFLPSGYGDLGDASATPEQFRTEHYELGDTLNWIKGPHTFNFGVDFVREHEDQRFDPQIRGIYNFSGEYSGNSFADFLLGLPVAASRELLQPGENIFESLERANHFAFFVQDDWRVTSNLTVNLGFRYEHNTPYVEVRNRITNFIPGIVDGAPGIVELHAPDPTYGRCLCIPTFKDLGPRLGLAYRPSGSDRTVFRAGYGIYYAFVPYNTKQAITFNPPQIQRQTVNNTFPTPSFDLANSFLPDLAVTAGGEYAMNLHYLDGMVQQWNADVQRELGDGFVADVSYLGSFSVHLDAELPLNAALPGPGAFAARRPYAEYPVFTSFANVANAYYEAGTAQIKKEFTNGLTGLALTAHYTWAKSLDEASSQLSSDLQNTYDLASNRGLSGFNVAHRFVASAVYELPFGKGKALLADAGPILGTAVSGWSLAPIYIYQSGFPFSATTSDNTANIESGILRPNVVGKTGVPSPSYKEWFNVAAFAQPAPYQFGSAGRNSLIGPSMTNLDLSILKDTRLSEALRLQFRGELFNAFNNVNFGTPNADLAGTNFGTISTAAASREVQFALKLLF
jgi:hypothetical protein